MKSPQKQHIHHIIFICLLMVVGWGQSLYEGKKESRQGRSVNQRIVYRDSFINTNNDISNSNRECEDGFVEDCSGDGDCCDVYWIGDGFPDCEDQEWGCDLTCYENDGGDCSDSEYNGGIPCEIPIEGYYQVENQCYFEDDINFLFDLFGHNHNSEYILEIFYLIEDTGIFLGHHYWNDGRLISLDLNHNSIMGIPISIGNVTYLNYLNLGWTYIGGEIPSEIGQLENLKTLNLQNMDLTGQIPTTIGQLDSLEILSLSGNRLSGNIPDLFNLSELNHFNVSYNQLSGEIPNTICENFSDIDYFYINNNEFCPPYPECLDEDDIGVQDCNLFPYCENGFIGINEYCYNQSDLDVIQDIIELNENLNGMESLDVGIQEWLQGNLTYLNLGSNNLTEIPPEIGNLTNLEWLILSFNNLTEIPPEIGNLTNLELLLLSNNHLSGEIPSSIGNLTNLTSLKLHDNFLYGEIPPEIGNLVNLQQLKLEDNHLSGEIPPEIGNLTNLTYLDLGSNNLTEIPPEIGNLTNLEWLILSFNNLTEIPPEIGNLTNLELLLLSNNQLTGEIPPEIGNLTNLELLLLYYNQLTGEIPPEIGNLTNLTYLNLGSNNLTGEIPETICSVFESIPSWGLFDISNNQLCPPYPDCIENYVGEQLCIDDYEIGDVNYDFEINISDIIIIVEIIVGLEQPTEQQFILSDWTEDGEINIVDIVQMVHYILDN